MDKIMIDLCGVFKIKKSDITDKSRTTELSIIRQIFCYVTFYYTQHSYGDIANYLNRDYSSIKYNVETAEGLINSNDTEFMKHFIFYTQNSAISGNLKRVKNKNKQIICSTF